MSSASSRDDVPRFVIGVDFGDPLSQHHVPQFDDIDFAPLWEEMSEDMEREQRESRLSPTRTFTFPTFPTFLSTASELQWSSFSHFELLGQNLVGLMFRLMLLRSLRR